MVRDGLLSGAERARLAAGSTGSRLISGNSALVESVEEELATFYGSEAALIFNSGYDANLGIFSCLARRADTILYDELCHASIRDGIRLSFAASFSFRHNDPEAFRKKMSAAKGQVVVAVESLYSMDGDCAPLRELADVCNARGAALVVDEAHATGVCGPQGAGVVSELGLGPQVFARVHTFGKALGCHGAAVVGSRVLRSYLVNFARSFIYTTALPPKSIAAVRCAHRIMEQCAPRRENLAKMASAFCSIMEQSGLSHRLIASRSQIQSLLVPGNAAARQLAAALVGKGFDVRAIVSPTVAQGAERLRFSLHSFNTEAELRAAAEAASGALHA